MNVLFIHQNFPGQFRHLVKRFASSKDSRVVGIYQSQDSRDVPVTFVRVSINCETLKA